MFTPGNDGGDAQDAPGGGLSGITLHCIVKTRAQTLALYPYTWTTHAQKTKYRYQAIVKGP